MLEQLRQMAVFAEVVRQGSMVAASKELGMSAAGVSQHIKQLETLLGVKLLNRTTRSLSVTEAGEGYSEQCIPMLSAAQTANDQVSHYSGELTGEIRITAPSGIANRPLSRVLTAFLTKHPNLRIRLIIADTNLDLVEHKIDLAIRAGNLRDSTLIARKLTEWRGILCASPAWVCRNGLPETLEQLSTLPGLIFGEHSGPYRLQFSEKRTIEIQPLVVCNNQSALYSMTLAGVGYSLQLDADVTTQLESGELIQLLPRITLPFSVYAVTAHKETPQKVSMLIDELKQTFPEL